MKNKNKVIILASIIVGVLVVTLGITYAVITFNETKGNSQLVLGDIWMKYEESNGISLEGVMPGSAYSNYFEFTVTGTNTYKKKDIYYDISLVKGNLIDGKTEANRIEDKYLQFKLVEVNGNVENEIFSDNTYDDLGNKRIHVATIPKNTENYSKTYRLYMTLSSDLMIGNTNNAILTLEEFNNAFASIKVNVTGDFEEKELENGGSLEFTDESCFTTTIENGEATIVSYNVDECGKVVVIPSSINGYPVTIIGEKAFYFAQIESIKIPNTVTTIGDSAFSGNDLTSVVIPSSVTVIESSAFYGGGVHSITFEENSKLTKIGSSAFNNNRQLTTIDIPDSVTTIESQAFMYTGLTSVSIPSGLNIIENGVFQDCELTSVDIPENIVEIKEDAFAGNKMTSVVIPKNVKKLGSYAFYSYEPDIICEDLGDGEEECYEGEGGTGIVTSVTIIGKTSTAEFEEYGSVDYDELEVFGWAEGYSDDDIEFINE